MDPISLAQTNFDLGFACSQSVFRAFAEELGIDPDTAARAAAAFGGGMGRSGRTCGAVTGALMVLGLRFGAIDPNDKTAKEHTYALARQFMAEFALRHGSVDCTPLIDCDLTTEAGRQQAQERNVFKSLCPVYVRDAAQIAADMLAQEAQSKG